MLRQLRDLIRQLIQWSTCPAQPGNLYVFSEDLLMSNRFLVHVLLPAIKPEEAKEVVSRKLTRTVNETGPSVEDDIPLNQSEFTFEAVQGDLVNLKLVHFDDAGNPSTPSKYEFTVIDDTPPSEPGQMMVSYTEIADEPPPAPPAPPEPPAPPALEPTPEPSPDPTPATPEDLPL